jgi:hypothetical protein
MIATLSSSDSISLESAVVVDFEVVITLIKSKTSSSSSTFEYTRMDTGRVTDGKLLYSAGRIVDYQSGWNFIDDAISSQLQPDCPALAPCTFFILTNKE